jgi:hypothetical protein
MVVKDPFRLAVNFGDNCISGPTTNRIGPGICCKIPRRQDHSLAPGLLQTCVQDPSAARAVDIEEARPVTRILVIY